MFKVGDYVRSSGIKREGKVLAIESSCATPHCNGHILIEVRGQSMPHSYPVDEFIAVSEEAK